MMFRRATCVLLLSLQFASAAAVEGSEAAEKVERPTKHASASPLELTASGHFHKPSPVVRKEGEGKEHLHEHHSSPHHKHSEEHRHQGKHASIHEHHSTKLLEISNANPDADFADTPGDVHPTDKPAEEGWVTCGGHKAKTCARCPITDASKATVFNHGQEWCHGDCTWDEAPTKTETEEGAPVNCFLTEGYTHSGTADAATDGEHHTPQPTAAVADLDNPNMTKEDLEAIDAAAKDAIKEEQVEAAEAKNKEEPDKMKNFWIIIICVFSVLLMICAVISCVALVTFCLMADPKKAEEVPDDAGAEAVTEGEPEF